ncbi:FAD-dependent oxidoreductase [Streptomyces phaeochromogenes]|uniref:FAD-dependent oxidoreductase n=1 Tax=Streptomyces phaeochromogenes TaxID=1923 RepID=UPI002DD92ECA|nr:FAD-dependent oxidoreductase [Streptomyces phaeochromogenes]WRZ34627.1 FAD-dependent oxidoreductase [Streptomyces phaeochromogenes]
MIAVVGAGLMGAATAWQLARQGHEVTLIEAYDIGHQHGSSHGSSRIYRRAYADPLYVGLTGEARALWHELEDDTGATLLRLTGGLDFGAGRDPRSLYGTLSGSGVPSELLTAAEANGRWPQFRFSGPVLHHPDAGTVDADAAVTATARRAAGLSARVLTGTRVTGAEVLPDGRVSLRTDGGEEVVAETVVVAAGAWLPELADVLGVPVRLPPLHVTQQQVFHFRQHDPAADWPVFVHKEQLQIFGLPSGSDGGALPAVKVAQHDEGTPTTAGTRTGRVDPASRAKVTAWVEAVLPGLDPTPVAEASCLYTTTPDEDFVLDRVGPFVLVSPCSGHGAKFAPLIGRMTADLALGRTRAHPRFALDRRRLAETPS